MYIRVNIRQTFVSDDSNREKHKSSNGFYPVLLLNELEEVSLINTTHSPRLLHSLHFSLSLLSLSLSLLAYLLNLASAELIYSPPLSTSLTNLR